jgi:hypothetical protein
MPEQDKSRERETESERILDRVKHESASGGLSAVERARGHFGAADADAADPIEVWGTRIGRLLGLLVVIAMFIWFLGSIFGVF